ncbi:MAG: DUF3330 domain-containing protein [Thioalkalispiraceae bacterium]|jgi:hypothetical protein
MYAKPEEPEKVTCQVCQRELPIQEALREEAEDYVFWFCGQDCLITWQQNKPAQDKE